MARLRASIRRIGTAGALAALTAAFACTGTAQAERGGEDTAARVVDGDCAATLHRGAGDPLTVDAGAVLDRPGVLTFGLGSAAKGTGEQARPTLSLPVADLVDGLGGHRVPVLNEAGTVVCRTAQDTTNGLVAALHGTPSPGDEPPGRQPSPPGGDPAPPDDPGDDQRGQDRNRPGGPGSAGGTGIGPGIGPASGDPRTPSNGLAGPGAIIPPVDPQPAPGARVPEADPVPQPPAVDRGDSGTARALPESTPPERLPLLLAVLALAVVTTLLMRSWTRGKVRAS
ncbi:hypothetical protein [Amycolatopsis cihanbeyliensis]|uniref:Uncharacterized protein n=1 Tax=Amycolatopsis cihanbeyliensis TaxID=1128664 RepID=A0A542DL28_AMYCI|nr:hypothetical protein [Amycolatopsis cihanbeyliensis]TQJ03802.1 hypothetical protein FB471_3570 [Amycolatopsis cihanbeyliensis]